jgi:hypothetical protein
MRQVTLAMLYGPKPPNMSALILECQERVASVLGDYFQPYDLYQVHATFVSLEEIPGSSEMNLNFKKYRGQHRRMDFHGLLDFIRTESIFPFQIQIGGFQDQDYPFVSQGQRPYKRSFSIIEDKIVIMGWPYHSKASALNEMNTHCLGQEEYIYPNTLEVIRRSLQKFNVLHTYHHVDTDIDNDFYFRIGLVPHLPLEDPRREQVEQDMRQFLSTRKDVIVDVTRSDVFVISFEDNKLLPSSTQIWPISDTQITPEFISQLYKNVS